MSTADRRTVRELLAESDALARETLLDATLEHAPAMVRSWNHLVGSAAKLWAVLVPAPDSTFGSDPIEGLRAIGEAIGRSLTTGHWPGHGPTDERLTQIADNFSRARHLVERHGRPWEPADSEGHADTPNAHPHDPVIYEQIRSGRLLTVTQGRRRLVPASSLTAYVDLLVTEAMARTSAHTP